MLHRLFLLFVPLLWHNLAASASPPPLQRAVSQLSFPAGETVSAHTIRVPFELAGRLIVVKAEVEGLSGNFLLDTGSERLILNSRHYDGGLPRDGFISVGTTGQAREVNTRPARDFKWDSLAFKKAVADIIDLSHIEEKKNIEVLGLIGYEVIRDFELLIDFQLRQITLTRLDERGERLDSLAILESPVDSFDFELQGHIIALKGQVEKTPVTFGLDSGAELNLLDRNAPRQVMKHFKIARRATLNGTGRAAVEVLAGKLYRFRLSDQLRFSGMRTLITNMDELNEAFRTKLDGLAGFEFLCMRRTIINYKKEKLYFLKWHRP